MPNYIVIIFLIPAFRFYFSFHSKAVSEPPNQPKTALSFLKVFDYFNWSSMTKENKVLSQELFL